MAEELAAAEVFVWPRPGAGLGATAGSAAPGDGLAAPLRAPGARGSQAWGPSDVNAELVVPVFFNKYNSGKKNWGLIFKGFSKSMSLKVTNGCTML